MKTHTTDERFLTISFITNKGTHIFNQITQWENVLSAYSQTQKGQPKHKIPAVRFRQNETENLRELLLEVQTGTYKPQGYHKFIITDPKERIIFAPSYRDKIVHHMIYSVLKEFYEPKFIFDSYACIRNKGNQAAVQRIQQHMRLAKRNNKESWLTKLDVSKFFPSIDREILKSILTKDIKCKSTLKLCFTVIDSSPTIRGLPLGCVSSQLFANVYLNGLDHFIKRELKVKHYVRYADDLFLITSTETRAKELSHEVSVYMLKNLNLSCAENKRYTKDASKGIDGLGYKIFCTHIELKSNVKKRMGKRLKGFSSLYSSGTTVKQLEQKLNSWCAHAKVAKSQNYINSLVHKFNWLTYTNNQFKINQDLLERFNKGTK